MNIGQKVQLEPACVRSYIFEKKITQIIVTDGSGCEAEEAASEFGYPLALVDAGARWRRDMQALLLILRD